MSSVLHVVSKHITMIESDVRDSLYKSVSKFWHIYRITDSINANIVFSLREIRTCLRKIKDDKSRASVLLNKSGDAVNVIINIIEKEYLSAFKSFISLVNVSKKKKIFFFNFFASPQLKFLSAPLNYVISMNTLPENGITNGLLNGINISHYVKNF
jgi:hypothetical protein